MQVGCGIYPQRSSTCREFDAGTPECDRARALHGLPPFALAGMPAAPVLAAERTNPA